MKAENTAILLFTRSLEAEFKAKSFGLTETPFKQFYGSLLKKTNYTLQATGLPVFEINSHVQVGNEFGERLTNAIKEVQDKGFHRVIIVGNDAPDLNRATLENAVTVVERGKGILGRDTRGGCYLVGFTIEDTLMEELKQVSWHSTQVFRQLNTLLQADTSLPLLADLNYKGDLIRALQVTEGARGYLVDLLRLTSNHAKTESISTLINSTLSPETEVSSGHKH